jgi:prepilin-type N-terminal cleavage/methylation domain-containing protein
MNKQTNKRGFKKGITLIEIIIAIVLIAIILGLTIPKIMSNAKRAEIKQTITSDVQAIFQAAQDWRKTTSPTSSYAGAGDNGIDGSDIMASLPSDIVVVDAGTANTAILSSGFRTGFLAEEMTLLAAGATSSTGVRYVLAQSQGNPVTVASINRQSFALGIELDVAASSDNGLGWDPKEIAYAQEVFASVIREAQSQGIVIEEINGPLISGQSLNPSTGAISDATRTGVAVLTCGGTSNNRCFEGIRIR